MMPQMIDRRLFAILALALIAACATPASSTKAQPMTMHARGTFTVKMAPLPADAPAGSTHGRLSLDKIYTGDWSGKDTWAYQARNPPFQIKPKRDEVQYDWAQSYSMSGLQVSFLDGHVSNISTAVGGQTWIALLSAAAGDVVGSDY